MKKPDAVAGVSPASSLSLEGDYLFHQYPVLFEYLSCCAWEDGSVRETSTLLLFWEEGVWKVCLNDRALSRVGFVSAGSPMGVLERVEGQLREEEIDWRRRREGGPSKPRGGK